MYQTTIKKSISFSGKGIHTGVYTNITLFPAKEDTGIQFLRSDLPKKPIIKANINNVSSTNRSTCLKSNNAEIKTVEHLLASLTGMSIDNIIIDSDNIEIPILDGSAYDFCELIEKAGIKQLNKQRSFYKIKNKITYFDKVSGTSYTALPSENYEIETEIDYDLKILKGQRAKLNSIENFKKEIASSRTFCFLHEINYLQEKGLIRGGDIDNAIIITDKKISEKDEIKLTKYFNKKVTSINGILNNTKLRFKNEPARHKILDIIGDLSLIGIPLMAKITSSKPGHKNNIKFAKYLKKIIMDDLNKISPKINLKEAPFLNKEKIKKILPHRKPFLFIDEIREIGDDYIIGVKYVSKDEYYFEGHFPSEPVMPGVLQLETMAQAGGVLILSTVEKPEDYLTFFMKIDNAKFKKKVVPGDIIIFRLNLISPIRRGLCHMHGKGFVNDKIVVEADLLAQITKKNK